jgi:hypothetical protein
MEGILTMIERYGTVKNRNITLKMFKIGKKYQQHPAHNLNSRVILMTSFLLLSTTWSSNPLFAPQQNLLQIISNS